MNRNKEFIFVDDKLFNFNENKFFDLNKKFENFYENEEINVNKFIKRKDMLINSLIKDKIGDISFNNLGGSLTNSQNNIPNNSPNNKNFDNSLVYENLIKNLKKRILVSPSDSIRKKMKLIKNCYYNIQTFTDSIEKDDLILKEDNLEYPNNLQLNEKDEMTEKTEDSGLSKKNKEKSDILSELKNIIKLHTKYINSSNVIKIEKEDKIILDFIFENINEDFYEISKFWIFEEYLLINEHDNPASIRRYETILNEIISRIEKQEFLKQENSFVNKIFMFLSEIPQYNEKVIDFLIKIYTNIFQTIIQTNEENDIELDKEAEKKDSFYINFIFIIYKKLKKKITQINNINNSNVINNDNIKNINFTYLELQKKLRNIFLNLSVIDNEIIIKSRIKFISNKLIPLGDVDEIQEYSKKQFKMLTKYTDVPINKNFVLSKYGLYFYLCIIYPEYLINDFVIEYPKVYSECSNPVCEALEKLLQKNFINRTLNMENLRNFIQNCNENCLSLILIIIKNIKTDIGNEKLFKEIYKYYSQNGEPQEILLALSMKINLFFSFVYEKIKIYENFADTEFLYKLFYEINNNSNSDSIINYLKKDEKINQNFEQINNLLLEKIKDKVIFYILFFIEEFIIKKNTHINKLNFFMKFFEKVFSQVGIEKLNENLNYLLELIKLKSFTEFNIFQILNYFLDYFKEKLTRNIISGKFLFNFS